MVCSSVLLWSDAGGSSDPSVSRGGCAALPPLIMVADHWYHFHKGNLELVTGCTPGFTEAAKVLLSALLMGSNPL